MPGVIVTENTIENKLVRVSFNPRGELVSLLDKSNGSEVMSGAGNRFCLYKDIPARFDAWDIDSMTENLLMPTEEQVSLDVSEISPGVKKIKLERKIHNSTISQWISLAPDSSRITFETTIDWHESHKLLKVAFPVNIHANEALHEIQFGHIHRPNHRSRPYDADRFEVCNHKWSALVEENRGVAILNDCKYGINVLGSSMNLTLLKSALAPDPVSDRGIQVFTYALYYWNTSFGESNVIREAYELNSPVLQLPGNGGEASLFSLDSPNIILESVKLAEDGSDDIIIRAYEAKRSQTRCTLSTSLPVKKVSQTDMLERFQCDVSFTNGKIALEFRPFEIKTIRLSIDKSSPHR
jgi:alpha-mannosidase